MKRLLKFAFYCFVFLFVVGILANKKNSSDQKDASSSAIAAETAKKAEEESKKKEALRLAEEEKEKQAVAEAERQKAEGIRQILKIKEEYCNGSDSGKLLAFYRVITNNFPKPDESKLIQNGQIVGVWPISFPSPTSNDPNVRVYNIGNCTYDIRSYAKYKTQSGEIRKHYFAKVKYIKNEDTSYLSRDEDWVVEAFQSQ